MQTDIIIWSFSKYNTEEPLYFYFIKNIH